MVSAHCQKIVAIVLVCALHCTLASARMIVSTTPPRELTSKNGGDGNNDGDFVLTTLNGLQQCSANTTTVNCQIEAQAYSAYNEGCQFSHEGYVKLNGEPVWQAGWCSKYRNVRGVTIIEVDPINCQAVDFNTFDTYENPAEATKLAAYLKYTHNGAVLVGVSGEEPMNNIQPTLTVMQSLGVDVRDVTIRGNFAFLMQKGYPSLTTLKKALTNSDPPATINVKLQGNITTHSAGRAAKDPNKNVKDKGRFTVVETHYDIDIVSYIHNIKRMPPQPAATIMKLQNAVLCNLDKACTIQVKAYSSYEIPCREPRVGYVKLNSETVWQAGWCSQFRADRGVIVLRIDPVSCNVTDTRKFDTFDRPTDIGAAQDLVDYIRDDTPDGTVLVGVTGDEPTRQLALALVTLKAAGVDVSDVSYRGSFAFVLQKGYSFTTVSAKAKTNTEPPAQLIVRLEY